MFVCLYIGLSVYGTLVQDQMSHTLCEISFEVFFFQALCLFCSLYYAFSINSLVGLVHGIFVRSFIRSFLLFNTMERMAYTRYSTGNTITTILNIVCWIVETLAHCVHTLSIRKWNKRKRAIRIPKSILNSRHKTQDT